MQGGALGPFAYVMPALSKTGDNAAFYSDTFRPSGVTRLKLAAMTLGERDGAPFFHCHGLWTEADGHGSGGHMLPEETVVAEPFEVDAFGIDGAMFTAEPDPETNFKLFGPVRGERTRRRTTSRAFALRLRPNQDFAGCLEAFCRQHGIARADARRRRQHHRRALYRWPRVVPFATELAIRSGDDRAGRRTARWRRRSMSRWSIISAASPRAGWCAATIPC